MLREEIDTALAPVRKDVAALAARTTKLEGVDAAHTQGIKDARVEVTRSKHEITGSTNESLLAASRHIASSVEAVATAMQQGRTETRAELSDFGSRLVAIEKQGAAQLVAIKDGHGTTSMVPAATVAGARVEGKQEATQLAANRADAQSLDAKKWAKWGSVFGLVQVIAQIAYHVLTAKP